MRTWRAARAQFKIGPAGLVLAQLVFLSGCDDAPLQPRDTAGPALDYHFFDDGSWWSQSSP